MYPSGEPQSALYASTGSICQVHIKWNARAFDSLVLPHTQQDLKQLILAFADAHYEHLDSFDDIIQGKGHGFIMLPSGPPGVGKTLTTESVAGGMLFSCLMKLTSPWKRVIQPIWDGTSLCPFS